MTAGSKMSDPFEDRIRYVAQQLLGVKIADFALNTGPLIVNTFEKQRQQLNTLIALTQAELNDLLTDEIEYPTVWEVDHRREMTEGEKAEHKRSRLAAATLQVSQQIATLEKLSGIYLKLTAGGIGQAMLTVAKAAIAEGRGDAQPQLNEVSTTGAGEAVPQVDSARRRFSAGRSAVVEAVEI